MKIAFKFKITVLLILVISTKIFSQTVDYVWEYITTYKVIAIEEMKRSGIPASIILAQGILESGWGKSKLAVQVNNHFGIKCNGWSGRRYYKQDDEITLSCFRAYSSAKDSYIDHTNFLTNNDRYTELFRNYDCQNYRQWAKGLKDKGYASDKNYAEKIIGIIERYNLWEFDRE